MTADLYFEGRRVPAAELELRARRLAGGLHARGIREGDAIAVLLRNAPVCADVVLACRLLGCAYCAINPNLAPAEIGFILQDCGARLLISQPDLLNHAQQILTAQLCVLAVPGKADSGYTDYETWLVQQFEYDGLAANPGAHIPYTAGTTGRPKGVLRRPMPASDAAAQRQRFREAVGLTFGVVAGCRALMPGPLYHSAPSVFTQVALQIAERLVLMPKFDARSMLELIETHRIDTIYMVPIMYVRLLNLPAEVRGQYDLSSLRFVGATGAPCAPDVKRAMIDWLGPIIYETYASSEAGMITLISAEESLRRPGSAGVPVAGAQLRIVDAEGHDCAPGEVGFIYVRQPAYPDFTYRGNEAARSEIERDGLVTLGDMGYLDGDGYLYVCDRSADMVISGGVNIYPAEIEHQLVGYPGVVDCAVFGIPDPEFGEKLMALLQVEPNAEVQASAVIDWLRERLAGFKIPRIIETVPELPRDDNGKIAKRKLRDRFWAAHGARRV